VTFRSCRLVPDPSCTVRSVRFRSGLSLQSSCRLPFQSCLCLPSRVLSFRSVPVRSSSVVVVVRRRRSSVCLSSVVGRSSGRSVGTLFFSSSVSLVVGLPGSLSRSSVGRSVGRSVGPQVGRYSVLLCLSVYLSA